MERLLKFGMTPNEVLASATSQAAEVFGIDDLGTIKEGKKAALLLIAGRPDETIIDPTKIRQIWVDGKPIL